jgi:hypothetical protein
LPSQPATNRSWTVPQLIDDIQNVFYRFSQARAGSGTLTLQERIWFAAEFASLAHKLDPIGFFENPLDATADTRRWRERKNRWYWWEWAGAAFLVAGVIAMFYLIATFFLVKP